MFFVDFYIEFFDVCEVFLFVSFFENEGLEEEELCISEIIISLFEEVLDFRGVECC